MTVFLCGFMGCGKSTIGQITANLLGITFIDMDNYIEEKEGMKIPEIFKKEGEAYFRGLETKAIKELSKRGALIACGGGAMLSEENSDIARKAGNVIFLDVPFEACYARIVGDESRPIAANNTVERLREIYNERHPIYRKNSTFSVKADASPLEISENIFRLIS